MSKMDSNVKNVFYIIFGIMAVCILMLAIQVGSLTDSHNKMLTYLNENRDNIEQTQLDKVLQPQQVDEFTLLSDNAKKLIDSVGGVTGTPTFSIDGKVYVGFVQDYVAGLPETVAYGELLVNADKVIMFASPSCGYCAKAEDYLNSRNVKFMLVCAPIHNGDYKLCSESNKYIY